MAVGAITAVSTLAGLGSLAVTGLYFTVVSLVVQVGIESRNPKRYGIQV